MLQYSLLFNSIWYRGLKKVTLFLQKIIENGERRLPIDRSLQESARPSLTYRGNRHRGSYTAHDVSWRILSATNWTSGQDIQMLIWTIKGLQYKSLVSNRKKCMKRNDETNEMWQFKWCLSNGKIWVKLESDYLLTCSWNCTNGLFYLQFTGLVVLTNCVKTRQQQQKKTIHSPTWPLHLDTIRTGPIQYCIRPDVRLCNQKMCKYQS